MNPSYSHAVSGFCSNARGYASAAEAIASSDGEEDSSGSEEIQELLKDLIRENNKVESNFKQTKKVVGGMGVGKYNLLRKRQIKLETEAWKEVANEYQRLLVDMCEQKLAPNLPYIKSLFLGWFEPLRNAIVEDQEVCRQPNSRVSNAPYFDHLPANKMAVITMHKLMGLLMSNNGGVGSVRAVQAACAIGEAIENEVRIHGFLEKTKKKKKNLTDKKPENESNLVAIKQEKLTISKQEKLTIEQERLTKKVNKLIKRQKMKQVREIVKEQGLKAMGSGSHVSHMLCI